MAVYRARTRGRAIKKRDRAARLMRNYNNSRRIGSKGAGRKCGLNPAVTNYTL